MKCILPTLLILTAFQGCVSGSPPVSEIANPSPVPTSRPSPSQSEKIPNFQEKPTPAPTATVVKVKAQVEKEVKHFTDQCLKNSVLPEQIHFPTDLTVSKNGRAIYMLASYCQQLSDKPNLDSNYDICIDKPEGLVPHSEKFVYQMKADNNFKPTPILVNEEPILGCRVKEIEATDDGKMLFLNDIIDYRIHKYDNQLSTLIEGYGVSPHGFRGLHSPNKDKRVFWDVPQHLKIENNTLLYRKIADAGMREYYETREVNLLSGEENRKYCTSISGQGFGLAPLSSVFGNLAYFFDITYKSDDSSIFYLSRVTTTPAKCNTDGANFIYNVKTPDNIGEMHLRGMVSDKKGIIYVSDSITSKIYKITLPADLNDEYGASLEEYAGSTSGHKDGNLSEAQFNTPTTLVIDAQDNIYVADTGNHAIRKITPEGVVSTLFKQEIP